MDISIHAGPFYTSGHQSFLRSPRQKIEQLAQGFVFLELHPADDVLTLLITFACNNKKKGR